MDFADHSVGFNRNWQIAFENRQLFIAYLQFLLISFLTCYSHYGGSLKRD
jgi:hypothetical protein